MIFILEKRLLWLWKLILLIPGTLSFEYWSRPVRNKDNSACKQLCVRLITHHFGSVQAITSLIRSRSELLLFHSTILQDIPSTHIEGKVKVTRFSVQQTNEVSYLPENWNLAFKLLATINKATKKLFPLFPVNNYTIHLNLSPIKGDTPYSQGWASAQGVVSVRFISSKKPFIAN